MSVFFRTGENTAASVSWPVYLFLVLPIQMMWLVAKALVVAAAAVIAFLVFAAHWVYGFWNDRKPPHPEG